MFDNILYAKMSRRYFYFNNLQHKEVTGKWWNKQEDKYIVVDLNSWSLR